MSNIVMRLVVGAVMLTWLPKIVSAGPDPFIFQQITNNAGLSNSSINCIFQDSSGLMWFGSWDGLNVYNGQNFRIYKPEAKNNNSISNNIIRDIFEQTRGILWIATDDGVNRFDAAAQHFKRFYFQSGGRNAHREKSYLLAKDRKNRIFCAVYELGLSYYNESKQEFLPLQIPGVNTFKTKAIFFDNNNQMWIQQESGKLYKIKLGEKADKSITVIDARLVETGGIEVAAVFRDEDNFAWLVSTQKGIYRLGLSDERLISYASSLLITGRSVTAMTMYNDKLMIAEEGNGVLQCRIEGRQIVKEEKLFPTQGIFSLYKGSQHILWVGSDGQGIYKVYPNQKVFFHYNDPVVPGITNNPIRSFSEISPGVLFVGTKGGGLFRINKHLQLPAPGSNGAALSRIDNKSGLNSNAVYALHHKNNRLWIGTDGPGIHLLDTKTGQLHHLLPPETIPGKIEFGSVYAICETPDSSIWLGTSGYGLVRLRVTKKGQAYTISEYVKYTFDTDKTQWLSSNIIYSLYAGEGDLLWIGTRGGGLNKFNYKTQKFVVYSASEKLNSLSSNDVLCIAGDKNGTLWIGTSNGINAFPVKRDKEAAVFTNYFEKNGLPNNTVHGIVTDDKGFLWISTNNGIARFDPAGGLFVNYTTGDGLQNNEFSDGAYYKSPFDGRIYFGGINGFNGFNAADIVNSSFEPAIHLNGFRLYNSEELLSRFSSGEKGAGISLAHDQNFFSFDFTALDYINNEKCEYAYMLEPFNKTWINSGTSHTAGFTNVPPGNYTLRIKCTNGDRIWGNAEYSLPVQVRLPWWRSSFAYAAYALLFLGVIYIVYRLLKLRIRFNRSLWEERMNRKKEEEIHEAKLSFFTNIAHEFCTPLTLIYGPSEKLLEYKFSDSYIKKYVHNIKTNAERMLALIQQLMDFRKTETGYLQLHIEEVDVPEMIRYISDSFSEAIDRNHIRFSIDIDPAVVFWRSDRSSLEKIVFNLLSNAVKYTSSGGSVSLKAAIEGDQLRLDVSNTGKGIKKEDIGQLFNRFKILDNFEAQLSQGMNVRTGLGLSLAKGLVLQLKGTLDVESEVGKLTTFSVKLPQGEVVSEPHFLEAGPRPASGLLSEVHVSGTVAEQEFGEEGEAEKTKVMIVDDEKGIRDFLFDTLSDRYAVIVAESAQQGLEKLKTQRPHIIICDLLMPGMNGLELTREVKTNILTSHIPVIMLTGKRAIGDQIRGLSVGADVYLPKPFYPNHLIAIIERLADSRKVLKNYYNSSASGLEYFNGEIVNAEDHEFIKKVTLLVEQNLENEILNPAFLSTELAISRMHLYRRIKEIVQQSPSEFIRSIRLRYASRQIITTSKTIQEIMFESGFNNKSHFFREFNKMFKTSPKEYRLNHNQVKEA